MPPNTLVLAGADPKAEPAPPNGEVDPPMVLFNPKAPPAVDPNPLVPIKR